MQPKLQARDRGLCLGREEGGLCSSVQHKANAGNSSLLVPLSQKSHAGLSCVPGECARGRSWCSAMIHFKSQQSFLAVACQESKAEPSLPPFCVPTAVRDNSPSLPLFLPKPVLSFSQSLQAPAELLPARHSASAQSVSNKWSLSRAPDWGVGWEVSSTPHTSARAYLCFRSFPFWNSWKSKPREQKSNFRSGVFFLSLTR